MTTKRAILIAGPTASGKSALAVELACRHSGVIINADSMQVYRELCVLTARPNAVDEDQASHLLYGHVSGADNYSVGHWLEDVQSAIAKAETAGRVPVIVGGTGLYFKALLEGISPIPKIPDDIRARWRALSEELTSELLYQHLLRRDPLMAQKLRSSDTQRILRALEVVEATGTSLAVWQSQPAEPVFRLDEVEPLVVAQKRDELYRRCDLRFDLMMEAGACQEVARLGKLRLAPSKPIMRALGVPQLFALLDGQVDRETAVSQAKTQTRRYAKRQLTWLRHNMMSWKWLNL